MVINSIVGVYIPIIRISYWRWMTNSAVKVDREASSPQVNGFRWTVCPRSDDNRKDSTFFFLGILWGENPDDSWGFSGNICGRRPNPNQERVLTFPHRMYTSVNATPCKTWGAGFNPLPTFEDFLPRVKLIESSVIKANPKKIVWSAVSPLWQRYDALESTYVRVHTYCTIDKWDVGAGLW